jgi:hypothetical protein
MKREDTKRRFKLLEYGDALLLILISIAAIMISIADFMGLLDKINFLPQLNFETLLLVLLGVIGLHLGTAHIERVKFQDSFEGGTDRLTEEFNSYADQLVQAVRGVQIKVFTDAAEQEIYLAHRLNEATIEVCDLSWKDTMSVSAGLPPRLRSHRTYETSIAKAAKRIPYREIFIFSDVRRIDKLKRRLAENTPGYSCRYFGTTDKIPRLQFVIIDREEIVFASSSYPTLCSIRQAELADIFQAYYEEIWDKAMPLKEGTIIHNNEVAKVIT